MAARWPRPYLGAVAAPRAGSQPQRGLSAFRIPIPAVGRYTKTITAPLTGGQAQTILTAQTTTNPATPKLVQSAQAFTSSGGVTTVTFGTPTTAGNTVIMLVIEQSSLHNGTVSTVTLGGAAGNFVARVTAGAATDAGRVEIWEDFNCAGGQTSVQVTMTGFTGTVAVNVTCYEVSGLLVTGAFDQPSSTIQDSTVTSWTTGTTPTLSQASEFACGMTFSGNNGTITGPGSPWTNLAAQGTPTTNLSLSGWQVTTATTGLAYAGTYSIASAYVAAIATFKAGFTTAGHGQVSVTPQGLGTVWYPVQCTISTTTGVLDSSTFNLYLGPANVPITLVGTQFPGGAGTIALAIPPMTPGQALTGIWTGGNTGDLASMNVIGTMTALSP